MWRFAALCEWSCLSVYVCVLCTSVYQHCVCVFICTYFRLWQLKKETYSSRRDGSLESDGGRAGLLHTHDLSAQNKALCSPPCERACQRKAEGLPLSASPSQRKHKSSAGSLTERDNLINHAAVFQQPSVLLNDGLLKHLWQPWLGRRLKKGDFDFIFLYRRIPRHLLTSCIFLNSRHLARTHWITWKWAERLSRINSWISNIHQSGSKNNWSVLELHIYSWWGLSVNFDQVL